MTLAREITRVATAHTVKAFERWLAKAELGDVCEYHRGPTCLVMDKAGKNAVQPAKKVAVAEMAWGLGPAILFRHTVEKVVADCGRGVLDLVQRRHGENDYSYLAIKRAPYWPDPQAEPKAKAA